MDNTCTRNVGSIHWNQHPQIIIYFTWVVRTYTISHHFDVVRPVVAEETMQIHSILENMNTIFISIQCRRRLMTNSKIRWEQNEFNQQSQLSGKSIDVWWTHDEPILRFSSFELTEALWRIYASVDWVTIDSDNGLSTIRHQAIIWTKSRILLFKPIGSNFSKILIKIHQISHKKNNLEMSSAKCWSFCLDPMV